MADKFGGPQDWADIASLFGSYADSKQRDRTSMAGNVQNYDQLMLQAQRAKETSENDTLRKLATTGYLKQGGNPYKPAEINTQGRTFNLPSFGFGPRATTAAQAEGANSLEGQLTQRLKAGGSYTPTDPSTYLKAGAGEKIGNIGGLLAGGIGAAKNLGFLNNIPGLGGGAGAAGTVGGGLSAGANAAGINSLGWTLPGAAGGTGSGAGAGAGTAAAAGGTGVGLAGALGTLGAGAGLALGYGMTENGLFRGGEEGVKVNPKRDSFSEKFMAKFGGENPQQAMATALASKGIVGPQADQIIQGIYNAKTMPEWNAAYQPFVQAGLGDVFVTTAADSWQQALNNRANRG